MQIEQTHSLNFWENKKKATQKKIGVTRDRTWDLRVISTTHYRLCNNTNLQLSFSNNCIQTWTSTKRWLQWFTCFLLLFRNTCLHRKHNWGFGAYKWLPLTHRVWPTPNDVTLWHKSTSHLPALTHSYSFLSRLRSSYWVTDRRSHRVWVDLVCVQSQQLLKTTPSSDSLPHHQTINTQHFLSTITQFIPVLVLWHDRLHLSLDIVLFTCDQYDTPPEVCIKRRWWKKKEPQNEKDSEQPDLNQRPKDISFPTTVFRYYQLSYARFLTTTFGNIFHERFMFIWWQLFVWRTWTWKPLEPWASHGHQHLAFKVRWIPTTPALLCLNFVAYK